METDDIKFKRYLLREFFWELEQHRPLPSSFEGVSRDAVEVLTFQGYDDLRIRVADVVFDVRLSWRKDMPPDIRKVEGFTG